MARSSDVEYKMRMTQDLKEKIVASAKEHNRSMNADIVDRLEKKLRNNIHIAIKHVKLTFCWQS